MTVVRWPRHVRYNCPPGGAACAEGRCPFCEGGLFLCVVCGGAEGDMPTDCPGHRMHDAERAAVMNGHLDFRGGRWVCTSEEARRPV